MLRLEVFINADPLVCAFTLDLIGKTTFSICQHIFLKTQHIQNLIPFIRSSQSSLPLLILLEFFIFFQQLSQENSNNGKLIDTGPVQQKDNSLYNRIRTCKVTTSKKFGHFSKWSSYSCSPLLYLLQSWLPKGTKQSITNNSKAEFQRLFLSSCIGNSYYTT